MTHSTVTPDYYAIFSRIRAHATVRMNDMTTDQAEPPSAIEYRAGVRLFCYPLLACLISGMG